MGGSRAMNDHDARAWPPERADRGTFVDDDSDWRLYGSLQVSCSRFLLFLDLTWEVPPPVCDGIMRISCDA